MIQVTYKKRNGDIIQRLRTTHVPYRVGETTSMGWIVLDIKYSYNGKFYHRSEYDTLLDKDWKRTIKICKIKRAIKRIYHELVYSMILIFFFRTFTLL